VSDVAGELDQLRIAVGEVEALAALTAESYDRADWGEADPVVVDRMASLLGLIARSATAAMAAFHRLHSAVADAAPAQAGEAFDYSDGTAPGPGEGEAVAMSAEDAAIVRRIRSNSPDGRYNGGSDAELIELFRRNKRVLSRSDEDVIAAMTHPR
jgi:hypothetical protein